MTDWGKIAADVINYGSAVLVAAQLSEIQSDYNKVATKYYSHYKQQRDFYFDRFQMAGEGPFVYEQFNIPFYYPDYAGMDRIGYFPPGAWFLFSPQLTNRVGALGDESQGYWKRFASRYSPTNSQITLDTSSFYMDKASIYDDWNSYMNRYEEHKRDVLNERRWANLVGSLSFGIKQADAIERGLATAFDVFDKAQGQLVSSLDTIGNGLATNFGYRRMQKALVNELGTDPDYMGSFFLPRE